MFWTPPQLLHACSPAWEPLQSPPPQKGPERLQPRGLGGPLPPGAVSSSDLTGKRPPKCSALPFTHHSTSGPSHSRLSCPPSGGAGPVLRGRHLYSRRSHVSKAGRACVHTHTHTHAIFSFNSSLKNSWLHAKDDKLRLWCRYVPALGPGSGLRS